MLNVSAVELEERSMKRTKTPVFLLVVLLVILVTVTSFTGIALQNGDFKTTIIKGINDIRWGIDIRGGVEATFIPATGYEANSDELESAKSIIGLRLDSNNITDYELYTDSKNNRIIVRFPWKSDEANFDPEEAINELAATAYLTFREGNEYTTEPDEEGNQITVPTGVTAENIIIEGSDVETANANMQQTSDRGSEYVVQLKLSPEGAGKFAEATGRLIGGTISIWMDDVMISAPSVNSAIPDGECFISGNFTRDDAISMANTIQAGALPFGLEVSNFSTINPTLGMSALEAMGFAGIIAFALISLFMLIFFRVPGVVSVFTLAGQMGLTFAAISGYFAFNNSFTMTLPGIAGIILSIGMGVDANIITASRITEELKNGRTLDNAVYKGCSESFSAVFDGNITILIVSIMLIGVFGPSNILSSLFGASTTGAIYSFGYTLLVGTIGNLIMGVAVTRLILKYLSGVKFLRNPRLYGGAGNGK